MKYIYILVVCAFAFTFSSFKQTLYKRYHSDKHQVTFDYPKTWQMNKVTDPVVCMFSQPRQSTKDAFTENVNLVLEKLEESSIKTSDYYEALKENMNTVVKELNILEENKRMLGKDSALEFIYTGSINSVKVKWRQIVLVKDLRAYVITYAAEPAAYQATKPIADKIIASFKIEK